MMGKFKSKAQVAFEVKTERAIQDRDWKALQEVFHQYGSYLELIDFSSPMSPPVARAHARLAQDLVDINVDNRELVYQRANTTIAAVTGGRTTHE